MLACYESLCLLNVSVVLPVLQLLFSNVDYAHCMLTLYALYAHMANVSNMLMLFHHCGTDSDEELHEPLADFVTDHIWSWVSFMLLPVF